MLQASIVVPCYNEAKRLSPGDFTAFLTRWPGVRLWLVDDGSTDATAERMAEIHAALPERVRVERLARNAGKAAAIRRGVLRAMAEGADVVGYVDADLATPLHAFTDLAAELTASDRRIIAMGSRVRMLGRAIERRPLRHYLGRVFATAVALMLRVPVYDTQCGAKLIRVNATTRALFGLPFISPWLFDVELFARLLALADGPSRIGDLVVEVPLQEWRDVAGSKLRPRDFGRTAIELARIRRAYLHDPAQTRIRLEAAAAAEILALREAADAAEDRRVPAGPGSGP